MTAETDKLDAERYRWLRENFDVHREVRTGEKFAGVNARGQFCYERETDTWYEYSIKDGWRLAGIVAGDAPAPPLDAVIDALRAEGAA
jgi:hypothetical protein